MRRIVQCDVRKIFPWCVTIRLSLSHVIHEYLVHIVMLQEYFRTFCARHGVCIARCTDCTNEIKYAYARRHVSSACVLDALDWCFERFLWFSLLASKVASEILQEFCRNLCARCNAWPTQHTNSHQTLRMCLNTFFVIAFKFPRFYVALLIVQACLWLCVHGTDASSSMTLTSPLLFPQNARFRTNLCECL